MSAPDLFEHVDRAAIRAALADARGLHEHARRVVASLEAVLGERDEDLSRLDPAEDLVTLQQAGGILKKGEEAMRKWIERHPEKAVRIGGRIHVKKSALIQPYR